MQNPNPANPEPNFLPLLGGGQEGVFKDLSGKIKP